MKFTGRAQRIDDIDLPRIGATIGVGEDEIHAVLDVETRGGGFDAKGRPKMLFEPHIFYRELSGSERERAVFLGLAYPKWGTKRYPRDSYPRLIEAMAINKEAALRSCSWGLGQIMGFNHTAAGYETIEAMVHAFMDDEENHLAAMVAFIRANDLDEDLRNHDWRGFARGYNGAGYAKHGYHLKLARAYEKWRKIPDTAFHIDHSPDTPEPGLSFIERLRAALAIILGKEVTV